MLPEPAAAVSPSLPEILNTFSIKITDQQKLWFLLKNISVFDCIEMFHRQSIVKISEITDSPETYRKNVFETDLGWTFESFIEAGKFIISERSASRPGTTLYLTESGASVGDILHITKTDDFKFSVTLEKKHG